uniref:Uncharacterized protein n=1 Tax=Kalanchoe fedtschenkoi TaxID=63787 RepID=A0A7N0UQ92_KALFE
MRMTTRYVSMWVLAVVLGLASAEARRETHPLFDLSSSREELVDLAGYGEEKLSTVLITGSVLCLDQAASIQPQPISGARVGLTCSSGGDKTRKSVWEETETDDYGDFTIDLPSHLHGTQNLHKVCQVKVVRVPSQTHCKASSARMQHKGIKLSSARNGVRTYTAGKIKLQQHMKPGSRQPTGSAKTWFANLPIYKWRG